MTTNAPPNHESGSRAAAQVAAWKQEIQSFFDDDWSRLRTLIMDLEEESWDDSSSPDLQCVQGNGKNILPSPESFDRSGHPLNHNHTSVESKPVVKDRLTELAEQIERRLQNTNTDGK